MIVGQKTRKALALLLPTGVMGISSALASAQTVATGTARGEELQQQPTPVAERLQEIREQVSALNAETQEQSEGSPKLLLAKWVNFGGGWGWRNGGWRNGGWGNGGWHNWGNGGWHNWGNGWHNWHNFWHNW
jgi:rSAM-associated Gly-rich repeat protein